MTEQPPPQHGQEDVTEALIAELRQRQAKGIATYGVSLQTWNGRSALRDALDEALDLAQYLKQALMEQAARPEISPYDREAIGRAAYEARTRYLVGIGVTPRHIVGFDEHKTEDQGFWYFIADAVIAAYVAQQPALDLDALARLAIRAHGITLQRGDSGTVQRYKEMLQAVLSAAWPGMMDRFEEEFRVVNRLIAEKRDEVMAERARATRAEQELLTAQWGLAFLARNGESDLDRRFAQSVLDGKPMETIEEVNDARLSHDTAEPHSEH